MNRYLATRRLVVALLAVSVSGVVSLGTAPPVRATTLPVGRITPWLGGQRAASFGVATVGGMAAVSDTLWTQQAELTSTAQQPNDAYGWAVALSGNTAAIGAYGTPYGSQYGAVYVFTRTASGLWRQQAELLDPQYGSGHNDWFGYSVALQGNLLVVGTPNATGPISYTGAAYVYVRNGSTWRLQAMLTASDAAYNTSFGWSVAINGATIVVGSPAKNNLEGAAYIFAYTGHSWVQQAEFLYPGHYLLAAFGSQVALWGTTALVAAPGAPVAFVYARSGTTWRLQAILSTPHSPLSIFGESVALWGNTALVGDCCSSGTRAGVVFVFTRSGATWSLQATLTPPGGPSYVFGERVALSYQTAVVGNGGAYVYVDSGGVWREQAQLTPTDRPPGDLGAAVAVQGNTALVSTTGGTPPLGPAGFVFVRSGAEWAADDALGQGRSAPTSRSVGRHNMSSAAR